MLDVIEKLLILQDRDRKILRLRAELTRIPIEREAASGRSSNATAALDAAKLVVKQVETARKGLELEVDSLKQKIDKYATQQLQTKKNDEYKLYGDEIGKAKKLISGLDDQQLELMEKIEAAQKVVAAANKVATAAKADVDAELAQLASREGSYQKELADLETTRTALTSEIDEVTMAKYTRLLKTKGESIIVSVEHHACGGCHMKLPPQVVHSAKAGKEIVTCINCSRILYYTRDMDLLASD